MSIFQSQMNEDYVEIYSMSIQRKHLQLIQTIDACETLVQAAERLHLTPSALSHQLRELETRLGLALVQRKTKPVGLTAAGKHLRDAAQDVLPRLSRLEQELARQSSGDGGRLHIAIECHSCYLWLMPTFDLYRQEWSQIELDIAGGFSFDGFDALLAGDLDLVVTADPEPLAGISFVPLFNYECVLTLPNGHSLLEKDKIEAVDLSHETLIIYPVPHKKLDVFRRFLHPAGVEPAHLRTCELTVMMMALVAGGRGLCALPNWAADEFTRRDYVACRSLGDGVFSTLYAAVREESLELAYMQEFLLLAKDMPFEHLEGIVRPAEATGHGI